MIELSAFAAFLAGVAVVVFRVRNLYRRAPKYNRFRHLPPLDRRPRRFPRWPNEGSSFARAQMVENMALALGDWQDRERPRESDLSPAMRKRLALRRKAFALVVEDRFFTGLPIA